MGALVAAITLAETNAVGGQSRHKASPYRHLHHHKIFSRPFARRVATFASFAFRP